MRCSASFLFQLYATAFTLIILFAPASACEGECIKEVTRVFVGNYSNVIETLLRETVSVLIS